MARSLLPLAASVLTCFALFSTAVSAADNGTASPATSSELRVQADQKRAHVTGADAVVAKQPAGAQTVIDLPVNTEDAPSVVEQK
jgi:hypothetical protein